MTDINAMEMWFVLQVTLEAFLVILMIVFLLKLKHRVRGETQVPQELQSAMERFLNESERLSETFSQNLKQKKELSVSLLLKLERKINEMKSLLEEAERDLSKAGHSRLSLPESDKANPAAPENRALVLKLADRGLGIEEIARKAHLHRGEVELIIDLERQFKL